MNTDRNPRTGQVPLPGFAESVPNERWRPRPESGEPVSADQAVRIRTEGIRRVRRMSNWTAAVLVVGTGAATVALAHNAVPISAPVASSSSTTTGAGTTTVTNGSGGPHVTHSVATTSASGVTTTTTTHVVNGKTVVSHVKHLAPGSPLHD